MTNFKQIAMTLTYDAAGFRRLKPDAKGYKGATALSLGDGREVVMMACGPEIEAALIRYREMDRQARTQSQASAPSPCPTTHDAVPT